MLVPDFRHIPVCVLAKNPGPTRSAPWVPAGHTRAIIQTLAVRPPIRLPDVTTKV